MVMMTLWWPALRTISLMIARTLFVVHWQNQTVSWLVLMSILPPPQLLTMTWHAGQSMLLPLTSGAWTTASILGPPTAPPASATATVTRGIPAAHVSEQTSFTSTKVKLRLRFTWSSPKVHLTTWPSSDLPLHLTLNSLTFYMYYYTYSIFHSFWWCACKGEALQSS